MIVVSYYQEEDYSPETDGYHLILAGVINDTLDLQDDVELIKEAIENCGEFEPQNGVMYEIYLDRATIASAYPIQEPAFAVNRIVEKVYHEDYDHHTPTVRL